MYHASILLFRLEGKIPIRFSLGKVTCIPLLRYLRDTLIDG